MNIKNQKKIIEEAERRLIEGVEYPCLHESNDKEVLDLSQVFMDEDGELWMKGTGFNIKIYDPKTNKWSQPIMPQKALDMANGKRVKSSRRQDIKRETCDDPYFYNNTIYIQTEKGTPIALFRSGKWHWELLKEPLFTTDEHLVYPDGKGVEIFEGDKYFLVHLQSNFISKVEANKIGDTRKKVRGYKDFATKKAAQEYVNLMKAVRESGLKVGDEIYAKGLRYLYLHEWKKQPRGVVRKVKDFKINEDTPCFLTETNAFYSISSYIEQKQKPDLLKQAEKYRGKSIKRMFGGKIRHIPDSATFKKDGENIFTLDSKGNSTVVYYHGEWAEIAEKPFQLTITADSFENFFDKLEDFLKNR